MKLVLCSEGFYTPNTVQACVELCGKPQDQIRLAIINEAYAVEEGDKRWVLDNLNDAAKNFPAELDIVNLLALPIDEVERRIMAKDVIFVVGGDTDYLMHIFAQTGFDKLLPKLLETKVYVGSSAGSIVTGRRISSEVYQEAYGNRHGFDVQDYLGFVDFAIRPHMDSSDLPKHQLEVLKTASAGASYPIYGLKDDSAVVVNGDEITFIGTEPYKA